MPTDRFLSRPSALVTVWLVGLAITGLELAAARLLAPFFGSTIFVYGSAIGVVLAALAVGYWVGGRMADQTPSRTVLACVVTIAGLSALTVPVFFRSVAATVESIVQEANLPIGVAVVGSMTALFTVPIVALGAVSPFALRLSLRGLDESGRWSGALSGVSTFGSILGSFLATFVTIPLLGTRMTIIAAAGLLILTGVWLFSGRWWRRSIPLALALPLAVVGANGPFIPRPGLVWEAESPYQLVQVVQQGDVSFIVTDAAKAVQSVYRPDDPISRTYYDSFALLPFLSGRTDHHRDVLIIGLAGGTMVRLYQEELASQFDFSITGVEIDPTIVAAARAHFNLDQYELTLVQGDARQYLRQSDRRFDVIIVDAYVHDLQIPPMLATVEFFQQVADHLQPDGIVGMNVAIPSRSTFYPKLLQTAAAAFPAVQHAPFIEGALNQLVLAGHRIDLGRPIPPLRSEISIYAEQTIPAFRPVRRDGSAIYTDDRTDLELRFF